MSQLSASEKDGALQEVKLLSELHHPFIVGYRESFLEGEVLHIVMTYCLSEDHQLLTNRGFLFLNDIERVMHSLEPQVSKEHEILIAAYNPDTRCIEYLPATALIINAPGTAQMVEFVSSAPSDSSRSPIDPHLPSQSHPLTPSVSPASPKSSSLQPDVSLCVTTDHDMYVRRSSHAKTDAGIEFTKQKAGSLLALEPSEQIQFLSHAAGGIAAADVQPSTLPFLATLSLHSHAHFQAALAVYGFIIGAASSSSLIIDHLTQALRFDVTFSRSEWLSHHLTVMDYSNCLDYSFTPSHADSSLHNFTLRQRGWFELFASPISSRPSSSSLFLTHLPDWCWQLSASQMRILLLGACVSSSSSSSTIYAPTLDLCDDLIRACLHAGFAATSHRQSTDGRWRITFNDSTPHFITPSLKHTDIRTIADISDANPSPSTSSSLPSSTSTSTSASTSCRTWCVTVPPHGLVITRRVQRCRETNVITSASQPVIIGNCEGGDLTTLIKKQEGKHFSEEQILDWFIQLCLSLRYIHQRRIIHRSI